MKPIVLIHGYSTEGKKKNVSQIYGSLPDDLRKEFGKDAIEEIDLSRWISLDDGVGINDIAFALDRALKREYQHLLDNGFHTIIHSTGALVLRTWIKDYSPKPSPIINLVHLAGANFGSGLAHLGRGQLVRWGRFLLGTDVGMRVLKNLEFGAGETLDLHLSLNEQGKHIFDDYGVQEFCLIGSQTPKSLRKLPIRYLKEDNSDCTVRVPAGNLNYQYLSVVPTEDALKLTARQVQQLVKKRLRNSAIATDFYEVASTSVPGVGSRLMIPFAIPYETAHFGDNIGIVMGKNNRKEVVGLIKRALDTPARDKEAYQAHIPHFNQVTQSTYQEISKQRGRIWDPKAQYEGHAMVVFRIRDQYGESVENFDLYFKSRYAKGLETFIEDKHINRYEKGTMTLYFRVQKFKGSTLTDRLQNVSDLDVEITGHEADTDEIAYVPFKIQLDVNTIQNLIQPYRTTIIDVTLLRLPSNKVFQITRSKPKSKT